MPGTRWQAGHLHKLLPLGLRWRGIVGKALPCRTGGTVPGSGTVKSEEKRRNSLQVSKSSLGRLFLWQRSATIRAAVWHWLSTLTALISQTTSPFAACLGCLGKIKRGRRKSQQQCQAPQDSTSTFMSSCCLSAQEAVLRVQGLATSGHFPQTTACCKPASVFWFSCCIRYQRAVFTAKACSAQGSSSPIQFHALLA